MAFFAELYPELNMARTRKSILPTQQSSGQVTLKLTAEPVLSGSDSLLRLNKPMILPKQKLVLPPKATNTGSIGATAGAPSSGSGVRDEAVTLGTRLFELDTIGNWVALGYVTLISPAHLDGPVLYTSERYKIFLDDIESGTVLVGSRYHGGPFT